MTARRSVQRLLSLHDPADASVLGLLSTHRVLTTLQLVRLLGAPQRTVEHRMRRLAEAGLVVGERPPRRTGSAPYHWSLTASGVAVVTGSRPRRNPRRLSPFHLAHAAAVSDFAVALAAAGPEAGLRDPTWLREEEGWERWRVGDSDRGVCPDGVAVVEVDDDEAGPLRLGAFVEVDMGTMSHPRLRAKALRYLAYANECRWRGLWECCPPVLLSTTTEQRVQTFLDGVERLRSGRLRNLHWTRSEEASELVVAACAEVGDPDAAVCDPVWRTGPDAAPVRLADLLAGTASAAPRRVLFGGARAHGGAWRSPPKRPLALLRPAAPRTAQHTARGTACGGARRAAGQSRRWAGRCKGRPATRHVSPRGPRRFSVPSTGESGRPARLGQAIGDFHRRAGGLDVTPRRVRPEDDGERPAGCWCNFSGCSPSSSVRPSSTA